MKKFRNLSMLIVLVLLVGTISAPAAAAGTDLVFEGVSATGSGLVAHTSTGSASQIGYMVHMSHTLVCEGYESYSGGDVPLGVPVEHMRSGSYQVTVWGADSSGLDTGEFYTFDVQIGGGYSPSSLSMGASLPAEKRLTAVKTPQATIYSDKAMSAQSYTLKQYDRVYYQPTNNPLIYYVWGYWVDGEPEIQEGGPGGYSFISNTVPFDGYLYSNAVMSHVFKEEIPKEIVNLAYTRLGANGVYDQIGRWEQYSQDCASFVYWVYREFGIPLGATTADAESVWLQGRPATVVYDGTSGFITLSRAYYQGGRRVTCVSFDYVDANIIDTLEPGDVVFFNWSESVYYYDSNHDRQNTSKQILESGRTYGVDHTGIYIGEGQYIHAADPDRNTIISPLAADLQSVVLIARPAELA